MEEEKMNALFAGVQYDIKELMNIDKSMKLVMQEVKSRMIDKFEAFVAKHPEKPFVIYDNLIYTYGAIDQLANRVANVAKTWNLQPRESVAIMIHNEPAFIYTFLGLQKLDIPVALINTNLAAQTLTHSLKSVDCKVFIVGPDAGLLAAVSGVLPQLANLPVYAYGMRQESLPQGIQSFDDMVRDTYLGAPSPAARSETTMEDTCCFIYTSGTTGKPKPVYISHLKAGELCCSTPIGLGQNPNDVSYVVIPMYHSTGLFVSFGGALIAGSTLVLRKKFSAKNFWTDCRRHNVTTFSYIGEMMRYLLSQPESENDGVHNLRGIMGAGMRADIWDKVKDRFKIPFICEFFGATEGLTGTINMHGKSGAIGRMSPLMSRIDPHKRCLLKFDFATAVPVRDENGRCVRAKIGEPGLFVSLVPEHIKGKLLYKADPEATEKKLLRDVFEAGDLYFNYGDAMVLDKEYFLYFYDRLGDTFRWKGENVSTKEVANTMTSLPFIEDANVYGVSVPGHDGKAGMAALTLTQNSPFLGNRELQDLYTHVCQELPAYARPLFVRHIPTAVLTGTFKNKKVDLEKEGYDFNKVKDALYFLDHKKKCYSPLTKASLLVFLSSKL